MSHAKKSTEGKAVNGESKADSGPRLLAGGNPQIQKALIEHADGLYLGLRQSLDSDFVLSVAGARFVGSESLVPPLPARGAYWWPTSSGVVGEAGDTIDVSITLQGTGTLQGRASAPPSAYFSHMPDTHDGSTEIEFRLYFGENNLAVSATMLRDHALEITGGTINEVLPVGTSGRIWTIKAQPTGPQDLQVSLPAATDCISTASICSTNGRMLRNRAEVTIPGPAAATQLASLTVGALSLSPAFSSSEVLYTADADADTDTVTVEAVALNPASQVEIAPGDTDPVTAGHQVALEPGTQTAVRVTVTSSDGSAWRLYQVIVTTADLCINPTPTDVTVHSVPIVVNSTTDEYSVLYVNHDVDGTVQELPVLVKLGEAGTTTLAENAQGGRITLLQYGFHTEIAQFPHGGAEFI